MYIHDDLQRDSVACSEWIEVTYYRYRRYVHSLSLSLVSIAAICRSVSLFHHPTGHVGWVYREAQTDGVVIHLSSSSPSMAIFKCLCTQQQAAQESMR